jgi:hypothetical protein
MGMTCKLNRRSRREGDRQDRGGWRTFQDEELAVQLGAIGAALVAHSPAGTRPHQLCVGLGDGRVFDVEPAGSRAPHRQHRPQPLGAPPKYSARAGAFNDAQRQPVRHAKRFWLLVCNTHTLPRITTLLIAPLYKRVTFVRLGCCTLRTRLLFALAHLELYFHLLLFAVLKDGLHATKSPKKDRNRVGKVVI